MLNSLTWRWKDRERMLYMALMDNIIVLCMLMDKVIKQVSGGRYGVRHGGMRGHQLQNRTC